MANPAETLSRVRKDCGCYHCVLTKMEHDHPGMGALYMPMVVCPKCGFKRCPRATHHRNVCTRSNEPGQLGSRYNESHDRHPPRDARW